MTPEQFVFWLRGYMASIEGVDLARADVKCIRETLAGVGTFNRDVAGLDQIAKQRELFPPPPPSSDTCPSSGRIMPDTYWLHESPRKTVRGAAKA